MPRDASGRVIPGSYDRPHQIQEGPPTLHETVMQQENDGGGEAGIRQAIAQRFPDALPDKLDEVYQAWQEHSHWAQRQGQEPDLEQFFQQYEADAQGSRFGARQPQEVSGPLVERMSENPQLSPEEKAHFMRQLEQQQFGLQ